MCITLTFSRAQLLPAVAGGAAGHERGGAAAALPCPRLHSGRLRGPCGPLPHHRRRGRRRRRNGRRWRPGPASGRKTGGRCWSAHMTVALAVSMQAPCMEPPPLRCLGHWFCVAGANTVPGRAALEREKTPVTCVCFARSVAASTGHSNIPLRFKIAGKDANFLQSYTYCDIETVSLRLILQKLP